MSRLDLSRIIGRCRPDGDCLLWQGKVHDKSGAPAGTEWVGGKDRYVGVRRRAYEEYHGVSLGPDDCVSCRCNNARCLEKSHLERLTISEKTKRAHERMDAASRLRRGRALSLAQKNKKLTPEQVREVLESADGPYITAARIGINGVVASRIVRGVSYRDYAATPWSGL